MTRPEMLLFDYGGTLLLEPDLDFERGGRALFAHVAGNPLGRTPEELARFDTVHFASFAPARAAGFEAHEHQLLRYTCEANRIALDVGWDAAEDILWDASSPMTDACRTPHVQEALAFCEREGLRTGVVSNITWSGRALRRRLDRLLPENRFAFVVASSEYGVRKPDRRLFDLALSLAGLRADRVWFIGDTFSADVLGAAGAGVFPVLYRSAREGAPFPYARIAGWEELPALLSSAERIDPHG